MIRDPACEIQAENAPWARPSREREQRFRQSAEVLRHHTVAAVQVPKEEAGPGSTKRGVLVPSLDPQRTFTHAGRGIHQLPLFYGKRKRERVGEIGCNQQAQTKFRKAERTAEPKFLSRCPAHRLPPECA
jgi:hypothetical protein